MDVDPPEPGSPGPAGTNPTRVTRTPSREVVHGDALAYLRAHPSCPATSVVASLPDVSELGVSLDRWREIFVESARLAMAAASEEGLCVFFQTDLKREGRWISKAALVQRAADDLELPMVWHKVVCRREPGQIVRGRPGFSHLLAFSRRALDDPNRALPDVLPDLGEMPWSHSMGTRAAGLAMTSIRILSPTTTRVLVPFCGIGTALAVANAHGFDAVGVEKNRKRAEQARAFTLDDA